MLDWVVKNWQLLWVLSGVVFAGVVWALIATFVKKKHHSELAGRVKSLEETYTKKDEHTKLAKRVTKTEVKIDALPTLDEIHKVALEMKEMSGKFHGVEVQLKTLNNRVAMLFENEIKGSK